jgi:tetratricopeptide (TPR) repeat protein
VTEEKAPEPNPDAAANPQEPAASPSGADASAPTDAAQPAAEAPPPPPEPLTPERAAAENRRNDLFIMAAALVVAGLLGAFKITDNSLWIHLKAGWQIEQEGVPDVDSFAYTTADKPWVNLNWLYDWGLYQAELAESRSTVRGLANDYRQLLEHRQRLPEFDSQGRDVKQPLPKEQEEELTQAFTQLASTAETSDTYQMRVAAERTAAAVEAAGLRLPVASQESGKSIYPTLAKYSSPGGPALISLKTPVVLKAILLAALAGMLLLTRHAGPTRWWAAVVAVLIVVAMGDRLTFSPEILSLLFLAITFWILHAVQTGKSWAAWLLIPLEALWVNVDTLFPLGIVLAALVLLGNLAAKAFGRGDSAAAPGGRNVLAIALGLSILAATFANPFGPRAWTVPLERTREMFDRVPYAAASLAQLCGSKAEWVTEARVRGNEVQTLAPDLVTPLSAGFVLYLVGLSVPHVATVVVIVLAIGSFFLNWRQFRLTRLLVLLLFLAMFLIAYRYMALVAMAAGVILCLNGQEWYLARFGTETRITRGWLVWSQGGRAVTIIAMLGVAVAGITGRVGAAGGAAGGGEFGVGIQWFKFDLGAGDFLREARLKGNALNTVPVQGNLLAWSNYPTQKFFFDGRFDLHKGGLAEFEKMKRALRGTIVAPSAPPIPGMGSSPSGDAASILGPTSPAGDEPPWSIEQEETWKTFLDKHNISHIILNLSGFADDVTFYRTYQKLRDSQRWKLVHRDSTSAIFGRVDLPEGHPLADDAAWFKGNPLDPAKLVFKQNAPTPPDPPAPVAPPTWIDWFWRTRRILSSQALIASHYLNPGLNTIESTGPAYVVPPENAILAIRHARGAIAKQQRVSPLSYAVLFRGYFYLYNTEMAILPEPDVHELRHLQLLSALNQLVAANPNNLEAQLQLAFRYGGMQFLDLADRHFDEALKLMPEGATIENMLFDGGREVNFSRDDIQRISDNLKISIEQVLGESQQLSGQTQSPVGHANYLISRGCPGMAIDTLVAAGSGLGGGQDASAMLARLYVRTGNAGDAERGAERELVNMQGAGGMRPGVKKQLWATVKLMQGDYEHARTFFEDAIAETRHTLAQDSLLGVTDQLRTGGLLNMVFAPATTIEDSDRQSTLEYQLGSLQLEAGEPLEAVRHFKKALEIRERIPYRDVIAFYIYKITGEELEPLPDLPMDDATRPAVPGDTTPAEPAPIPPKPSQPKQDEK